MIGHLSKEIQSGRYTTADVKTWLIDCGYLNTTMKDAKNLRYRIPKDLPIRGWNIPTPRAAGERDDFLHNSDLARKIVAGGAQSLENLKLVLLGISSQEEDFD